MFSVMMPKNATFFDQFNAHAERCVVGASAVLRLVNQLGPTMKADELKRLCDEVDMAEASGDQIEHDTIVKLHKEFITPMDRDQIHGMIMAMDSILDRLQDVAESVILYDLHEMTSEAREMAGLAADAVDRIAKAVKLIKASNSSDVQQALAYCKEVDDIESKADKVWRGAMSRLFKEEQNAVTIMKLKGIYDVLEMVIDAAEGAAHTIEEIVLENA